MARGTAHKLVMISREELERMRRLAAQEMTAPNLREERNKMLREKSLAKKKNWPNTLEAIRDKKVLLYNNFHLHYI